MGLFKKSFPASAEESYLLTEENSFDSFQLSVFKEASVKNQGNGEWMSNSAPMC